YLNRGIAYQWHEDYTKAIADFDRAIRAEPTFVEAYRARAITYWKKMGRSQEAAEDFRAILKLPASNEAKEEARSALEELRNAERRCVLPLAQPVLAARWSGGPGAAILSPTARILRRATSEEGKR